MTILLYQYGKVGSSTLQYSFHKSGFSDIHHTHFWWEAEQILDTSGRVNLICGVREPLSRAISEMFQNITDKSHGFYYGDRATVTLSSIDDLIIHFNKVLIDQIIPNVYYKWFEDFHKVTAINFEDLEKMENYWFCKKDNINCYIYKLENFDNFVSDFIKIEEFNNFVIHNRNISSTKWYGDIYKQFKQKYKMEDHKYKKLFYDLPWFRYFYL